MKMFELEFVDPHKTILNDKNYVKWCKTSGLFTNYNKNYDASKYTKNTHIVSTNLKIVDSYNLNLLYL